MQILLSRKLSNVTLTFFRLPLPLLFFFQLNLEFIYIQSFHRYNHDLCCLHDGHHSAYLLKVLLTCCLIPSFSWEWGYWISDLQGTKNVVLPSRERNYVGHWCCSYFLGEWSRSDRFQRRPMAPWVGLWRSRKGDC